MVLLQNLYILNVHCLVRSVLLPGKEVLGDRIQDVGAEDLRQRSTITDRQSVQSEQLWFGKYLVLENLLRHRVCPFHNWNVHVDDLELVWPANK